MTNSNKKDIIDRVNGINKIRHDIELLEVQKSLIKDEINKLTCEVLDVINNLKKDMGGNTTLNIRIEDKYFTLVQHAGGVDIDRLIIDIDRLIINIES